MFLISSSEKLTLFLLGQPPPFLMYPFGFELNPINRHFGDKLATLLNFHLVFNHSHGL